MHRKYKILAGYSEGRRLLKGPRLIWEYNIKTGLKGSEEEV